LRIVEGYVFYPSTEYCENSGIDIRYVSVAHRWANGQVERANGLVLDALKKQLHDAANTKGGKWIKELPNALWGLRTQPTKPTGQSPYSLAYSSEAILPTDVMWDSPAVEQYDEGISENRRRVDIDGLEEARCATLVQSARYLEGIRRYHDRNVKERSCNVGDLVLRRFQNMEGLHCDAPGFQPRLINPNDPVNSVDFGQMTVNLGRHRENITNDP
jgi:hypothetical protein